MLISYDGENGFGGLIKTIQKLKELPPIIDEIKNGFNELFNMGANTELSQFVGKFDELAEACGVTDKNFAEFLETTQESGIVYNSSADAIASYQQWIVSTGRATEVTNLKTKALAVSMKVLSSIGWAAIITAITWVIGKVIEGINYLSESSERAIDKTEKLRDTISLISSNYNSNRQTLVGLKDEYDALTKKIGENDAEVALSADEYERYRDITSQILGITPQLITSWNDEGEAISNKNGLLQQSIDLLDEEYRKSLRNNTTKAKNEEIAAGIIAEKKEFDNDPDNKTFNGTMADMREDFLDELQILYDSNKISYSDIKDIFNYLYPDKEDWQFTSESGDAIQKLRSVINNERNYKEIAESFTDENNPMYGLFSDKTIKKMKQNANEYFVEAQRVADEGDQIYQKYRDQLSQNAQSAIYDYDPSGEIFSDEAKAGIIEFINSIDYSTIKTEEDFSDMATNLKSTIQEMAQNNEIRSITDKLFELDLSKMSPQEFEKAINDYINQIMKIVNELEVKGIDRNLLLEMFRLSDDMEFVDNFNSVKDQIARDIIGVEDGKSMNEGQRQYADNIKYQIDQFAKQYSINTQDEIAAFNDAYKEANRNLDKALEIYLQKLAEKDKQKFTSFESVFNSDSFKESKNKLLELAKAGELSDKTLESTEEYLQLLTDTGLEADDVKDKIYNLLDAQEKLAGTSENLDKLSSSYEEFKEKGFVTAETLSKIPAIFQEMNNGESFDIFSKIVGDPKSSVKEMQNAFDILVGEYIKYTSTMEGISLFGDEEDIEKTKRTYIANLTEMGIANAEEVVNIYSTTNRALYDLEEDYLKFMSVEGNTTSEYLETVSNEYATLINFLGDIYTEDLNNYLDLLAAKEKATALSSEYLKNLGLTNYDKSKSYMENYALYSDGTLTKDQYAQRFFTSSYGNRLINALDDQTEITKKYEEIRNKLNFDPIDFTSTVDWNGSESDTNSSSSDKTFDWIEVKLENLNKKLDEVKEKTSDTLLGFTERNKAIEDSISQTTNLIAEQERAEKRYLEEASKSGLSKEYQKLVELGAIDITKLSDSEKDQKLAQQIQDYQEWYEKAKACREEIENLNKSILELNVEQRELKWSIFDYLEESLAKITEDANFLVDLLSKEDLFEEDGTRTKYADATLGLHKSNYDIYMQQAKDYYEEMQELEKALAEGAGQDVQDKYNERVKSHQDAINAAVEEKEAILDLVEEGYKTQLDYLNELINKRKEAFSAEKTLYDYQKNIEEKTKNITSLQRQYNVALNDDSEEGKALAQKLKVELEEAKTDLEETEYNKYISDQEQMLDQLSTDYEDWMNKRLDNSDSLLEKILLELQGKGESINDTLDEVAKKNGTTVNNNVSTIFNGTDISKGVTNAVQNLINEITNIIGANTSIIGHVGAYASGTKRSGKEWAWTQEEGVEIIRTKDGALLTPLNNSMVFNNESSKRLWEFSQDPIKFFENYNINPPQPIFTAPKMPNVTKTITNSPNINLGGINIVCNEVNNADDIVNELISNRKFEKAIHASVGAAMTGGNSLSKLRF